MSENSEITCNDCELQFSITWHYDSLAAAGEATIQFCPRCGSEDLVLPEEEE